MIKKLLLLSLCIAATLITSAQEYKSTIREQHEKYAAYNFTSDNQWDSLFLAENPGMVRKVLPKSKSNCNLNKVVYGWCPYWHGTTYLNYQWDLLTHLSHFSYEVNASTGAASSTHNWTTDDAVDSALANGVKVDLCVTLFSNHATFLGNATAKQTLITNLINMVQSRGANGVNIDFEGLPSTQATNFTNFMVDLCNQMHTAIPGSQVSIALYSVDWNNVFDEVTLNQYVDMFIIMGYDYYYGGSTTAGPNDPLYNFITSYNYTLTKSITYYLNAGISPSKLILGLPYYGKQWATVDNSVGSATTASGTSPIYNTVRANTSGNYSNKQWNATSFTPYYAFQTSGQWYQCWIDDAYSLGKRFDLINQRGIGGMGIWALGYDDGYTDFWNKIESKFTSCSVVNCSDTIYDMGGPQRNYYDNENYTYTIAPNNATGLTLTFNSFSVANDTLWIYNGNSTASPLIGAYTSTNNPGIINASGGSLTLKFRSRASTNSTGWDAVWQCIIDNVAPTTTISTPGTWKTQNFTATFTDNDNVGGSGIQKSFYQVLDYNGTEWHANAQNGFFADNFDSFGSSIWTIPSSSGTWNVSSGNLNQTDTSVSNTNIYAALNQNLSNRYVYQMYIRLNTGNSGTSQHRFGFHFFSDNANLTNRGNSYFIFFRQETSKLEFYKVVNDTYTQVKVVDGISTTYGQWYDLKIIFDRITGKIDVYRDDVLIGTWTDSSPLTTQGNFVSFRTGNCKISVSELKVFRSRNANVTVSVGSGTSNDIRYQNTSPSVYAAKIKSIVNDNAGNLSLITSENINVDWTKPIPGSTISDGLSIDIDTTQVLTSISASWSPFTDPNSGIASYHYCFGTSPGNADLIGWSNNGNDTSITRSGFNLQNGLTYYCSVYAQNNAGLISDTLISDGLYVLSLPHSGFSASNTTICENDNIVFTNNSTNATSYQWSFQGGNPPTSNLMNPVVHYANSGTYDVELVAVGLAGNDTLHQTQYITVYPNAIADFSVSDTLVYLPTATVIFTNTSTNASLYSWNFGDGNVSTDQNPWHQYNQQGVYDISLIAYSSQCKNDTLSITDYIHVENTVGLNNGELNELHIYPNPAHNQLYIDNSQNIKGYEIFDVSGKKISENFTGTIAQTIDLLDLAKGFYKIRIYLTNNTSVVLSFSKE